MTMRLDAALAARGLARSRTHAQTLIAEGRVSVDGRPAVKPATPIREDARLDVAVDDHYVSRAAHKLLAALDIWPIPVRGRVALDLGASTGGFTQVLRERGADPVVAVDVGHGQMSSVVAADPGVHSVEGVNVRYLTPESLAEASGILQPPGVVTGDLSFISLTHIVPAIAAVMAPDADVVLLIKPQFEVGRTGVREGIVTDPLARADAANLVLWSAWDVGLRVRGVVPSPIAGTHGNRELLAWLSRAGGEDPSSWREAIDLAAGVGS